MIYESFCTKDTFNIASDISSKCTKGQIYCLNGELGTGKTVFAKGFANGLNINEDITSPTFTLMNEYNTGRIPLYHFDVYRINSIAEMDETGYEDYFYGDGVCLIEWANLILKIIPHDAVFISIEKELKIHEDYRLIKVNTKN